MPISSVITCHLASYGNVSILPSFRLVAAFVTSFAVRQLQRRTTRSHVWGVEFMCGLTKDIVERLRGVVEALRVGQDDLIPFNVATLDLRVDYFCELVLRATGPMVFS
jgi:hypothetical protein